MRKIIKFSRYLLRLSLLFLSFSCSQPPSKREEKKPVVLVTIAPYAYFAKKIVGDTVQVEVLVPPGMNVHTYEPSPKFVEAAGRAEIFFTIQETVEERAIRVLKEKKPDLLLVDLQRNIPLLSAPTGICSGQGHHHGDGHKHHEGSDLHTWLNPAIALRQAQYIAEALSKTFPTYAKLYQANFDQLAIQLRDLDRQLSGILAPYTGQTILATHPSFAYFCNRYGLFQMAIECEGKDPRPREIEALLQKAAATKVICAFLQKGFNNRGTIQIAKHLQIPTYEVDPYGEDYPTILRQIAGDISR